MSKNTELEKKIHQAKALLGECIDLLYSDASHKVVSGQNGKESMETPTLSKEEKNINFDMHPRAFFKKYGRNLSGRQRFALVLANIVKGDRKSTKTLEEISTAWGRFESLIGKYNPAYSSRALEDQLVDSPKAGFYSLGDEWGKIFD